MPSVRVQRQDGDRFHVEIRGHSLTVDQPIDAGGDDSGPTPVELFVGGLAACVGVYAGRFLDRHMLSSEGLSVECDFNMSVDRPARVSQIEVRVVLPEDFPEERREALVRVIEHCTVHNSIRRAPGVAISLASFERVS